MNEIVTYAMQTVACSALFTVFYQVVLQGRTSFRTARRYLLASMAAAAVIPALDIPLWRVAPIEVPAGSPVFDGATIPASASVIAAQVDRASIALWALWGVGLALLAFVMVRQIVRISAIRRRAEIHPADGFRVAVSGEVGSPFSFLDTVFIGRGTPADEIVQIVTHEASHVRHRHSVEKLAMEGLKSLQWFNPFAWWAARLLAEVHEFEADRDVLDGGSTVEEYLPLILRQTFGCVPELTVGLGNSLTKKRFLMMKNMMKPTRNSWLRVAGAVPLAAGAMMLFSFTSRPPEIIFTEVPEPVAVAPVPDEPERTEFEATVVLDNDGQSTNVVGRRVETYVIDVVRDDSIQVAGEPRVIQVDPIHTADVMPKFEGGDLLAFRNWVNDRIVYPREAAEKNITGVVTVRFVIERDGSLSNIEVLNSPDESLAREVIRVMGLSPRWTPGRNRGQLARVYYVVPIQFSLVEKAAPPAQPAQPDMSELRVIGYGSQRRSDGVIPLVFLDGIEITEEEFRAIDPNTIQSIDVLKDASATERYGDRAKDGVILITLNNNTFVWNDRENRPMSEADYTTTANGEKTIDGTFLYTEDLDRLPAEIKAAMGNTRYRGVMIVTPR